jgi:hypothetical protein
VAANNDVNACEVPEAFSEYEQVDLFICTYLQLITGGLSVSKFEFRVETLRGNANESKFSEFHARLTALFKGSESVEGIRSAWAKQASLDCEPSVPLWEILLDQIINSREDEFSEPSWLPDFRQEFEDSEGLNPKFSESAFDLPGGHQSLR